MELVADTPLALTLVVLALVDGLSIGTLLIPLFLLLAPGRVRIGRLLLYLGSIAGFYLLVGLLFLWGLVNVVDVAAEFLSSQPGMIIRLVVGAGLLIGSFFIPGSKKKDAEEGAARRPGRVTRWRDRLLDPATRPIVIVGVAIAAGLVEVATMLPYIAAMTTLANAGYGLGVNAVALAVYCVIMIAPALVLVILRVMAARQMEGPLQRFAAWLERTGGETTAWIIGIVGFLLARSAATELGLLAALGEAFPGIRIG